MNDTLRNVIIVGSGPSGYTAALYCARAELRPFLFEGAISAGGALMNTTEVENFPGFPEGVLGPDLMDKLRSQAERFGTEFVTDDIVEARLTGQSKELVDSTGQVYRTKSVILATGSRYRELGLENEKRLSGRGVSWCATCDGFFFREKDIVVVGGGDSALEEATFLTRFARSVTIVHRREKFRASKIMQDRVRRNEKIRVLWNREVLDIIGDEKVDGVRLREVTSNEDSTLAVSGVFVAIGHDPQVGLVEGQIALNHAGYIAVDGRSTRTNMDGVFACGDVVDHEYRQAITAAGSGCAAALDAERYLMALHDCATPEEARVEATAVAELAY
ncbi:thioredoxin-disulfide reductase [Streptomyces sp. NBC_01571]|uniref:thioredoxin-disulfide reductase n=1 Tax=Streptomyces sp. NBC_01571 TaxID=2975883 RepID=UPI00225956C0|nr:thioredoxin-disulfide reductase [Streptomyces sp. NBC_01571]MCX4580607.1 thioredoxin-disulfide reductase [Streptomyces sp. NBC_01571]